MGEQQRWVGLYRAVVESSPTLRGRLEALVQCRHAGAHPDDVEAVRARVWEPFLRDRAQVSKILGHKNIAVTAELYGNLFDQAAKDITDRAAGAVPRQGRRGA